MHHLALDLISLVCCSTFVYSTFLDASIDQIPLSYLLFFYTGGAKSYSGEI